MSFAAMVARCIARLAAVASIGVASIGVALIGAAVPAQAEEMPDVAAPKEHRRGADQTFLTYPEWFLVHSPAEYAAYVNEHTPTRFPFQGHVAQFWQSYKVVFDRIRGEYPFNAGYHVMILVIGVSTTIEYEIRSAYETVIGRLSELTAWDGLTEEDRYGAAVAQDYVDFIRVQPWYEYDFLGKLAGMWKETALWGLGPVRKWERKYALTTEYSIKAAYGWLIKKGTKASYDAPLPVTAVVVAPLPEDTQDLPDLKVLASLPDDAALITVPRYDAFMRYADALALRGASFVEIAGNRSVILVSALVPENWAVTDATKVLFTQPVLTQPGRKRVALEVPVAGLAALLNRLRQEGVSLEHVYDY